MGKDVSMTVSVVIPAWGETPFLSRAIDSVRNQTCADLELIVADPPKTGPPTTPGLLFAGFRKAHGEGALFIDADDWIDRTLVEKLLAAADSDAEVVVSGLVRGKRTVLFPTGDIWEAGPSDVFNCLCARLFRKELFAGIGDMFDISLAYGEDLMAAAFLLYRAKKVVILRQALYHYCDNMASMTHTLDGRQRVLDLMRVGEALRTLLPGEQFAAFHDRVTRDALLLWCRYCLWDRKIWRELRVRMTTPLLADRRHGLLKKGVLFCAHCFFD